MVFYSFADDPIFRDRRQRGADENTLLQPGGLAPATAATSAPPALISVDARHGPAPAGLERLAGRAVLRTDLNGTLKLLTDGKQMWAETVHANH